MAVLKTDPRFGIYIHWPYCESKCPYCDFNSHVRDTLEQDRWLSAYLTELDSALTFYGKINIDTIFFGGGTPSLMEPYLVESILQGIKSRFGFQENIEITLEANPSSSEVSKFKSLYKAGINRLSLGVQSFDDGALKFLGRKHDANLARDALSAALEVFPRTSFDLIYSLPGQSNSSLKKELSQALSYGAKHISAYQLTLETGTPFFYLAQRGKLKLPRDEVAADQYEIAQDLFYKAGLKSYEISNYAMLGEECRHNLLYWRSLDWIGVGPGAHGRKTSKKGRIATTQHRSPEQWISAVESGFSGIESKIYLKKNEIYEEFLLMGLRLKEGIEDSKFQALTGTGIEESFGKILFEFVKAGLLEWDGKRLSTSDSGSLVLDALVAKLCIKISGIQ